MKKTCFVIIFISSCGFADEYTPIMVFLKKEEAEEYCKDRWCFYREVLLNE